jgi:hypothetical protein
MQSATRRPNVTIFGGKPGHTACEVQLARHRGFVHASLVAVGLVLVALGGCSGSLPQPDRTRHTRDTYLPVPYPPPAGLAETVPPPPERDGAVWIDGEWVFHGSTYVWQRGGWVYPPPGARYAPWRALYQKNGRLWLAPGTWYDENGNALPLPEIAKAARTPPNEVTAEMQTGR